MNPTSTLFVTNSGRVVDMFAPDASDIDFDDVAEALSKEARYNGGTPNVFYTVAQHLVLGADWIIADATGQHEQIGCEDAPLLHDVSRETRLRAAYFLTHDFHEYVLKDETTPKKRALDRVAFETLKLPAGVVSDADVRLTERWDAAIHEAAGLTWPPPKEVREFVDTIDKRILLTEWAALKSGHRLLGDYSAYTPLPIKIAPYSWGFCCELLSDRMRLLLPAVRKRFER